MIEYAPVTVINVTPVISKNALGKVNGITAATSVINGDFALGQACTLNIQKHATLKIATDAKLGTEGYKVTIKENQEHESDYATGYTHTCTGESKLLVYGTIVQ